MADDNNACDSIDASASLLCMAVMGESES